MPLRVSVVIPAYQEGATIEAVLRELVERHRPDEVIVADGGSTDQTVTEAARWAAVVQAPKGRAAQMNAGAASATGDVLLFLHADTRLPPGALEVVRHTVAEEQVCGGRFRVRFDQRHPVLRFYEWTSRWPWCSTGDQAMFVTRSMFATLGGFREEVALEDVDFYRRLRRQGRTMILREAVLTSSRRLVRRGFWRQFVVNTCLGVFGALGWDVTPLVHRWYPDVR